MYFAIDQGGIRIIDDIRNVRRRPDSRWRRQGIVSIDHWRPLATADLSSVERQQKMTLDEFAPDGSLSPEQASVVKELTPDQLVKIDEDILANCCGRWRKVSRIVATTMMNEYPHPLDSLPDVFFAQRVRLLVEQGSLESQGHLDRMRYSEVRFASAHAKQDAT